MGKHSGIWVVLVALIGQNAPIASAATISWGAAQNIANDSDVLTLGTSVYAYAFGTDVGAQTVNGVDFSVGDINGGGTNVTITGSGLSIGHYFHLSSPASYNGILKGAVFGNSGAGFTVTLSNLVEGKVYAVQVWSANVDYGGTDTTYDDAVSLAMIPGQYAIGTFLADASGWQVMSVTGGNYQINALQVRAAPEPGSPRIAIISPTNNATVSTNFTIKAVVWDPGTVTNVCFYDGATLLGNDVTGPAYSNSVIGALPGTHELTVVAWTNGGMAFTSTVVNVTVALFAPTVAITSPITNTLVGTNFTITATATDSDGFVTNVYFYDGIMGLGSDDTGPAYSCSVTGAPLGAHSLTAVAWDNDGMAATSAVVNVTVTSAGYGDPENLLLNRTIVACVHQWYGSGGLNVLVDNSAGSWYFFTGDLTHGGDATYTPDQDLRISISGFNSAVGTVRYWGGAYCNSGNRSLSNVTIYSSTALTTSLYPFDYTLCGTFSIPLMANPGDPMLEGWTVAPDGYYYDFVIPVPHGTPPGTQSLLLLFQPASGSFANCINKLQAFAPPPERGSLLIIR